MTHEPFGATLLLNREADLSHLNSQWPPIDDSDMTDGSISNSLTLGIKREYDDDSSLLNDADLNSLHSSMTSLSPILSHSFVSSNREYIHTMADISPGLSEPRENCAINSRQSTDVKAETPVVVVAIDSKSAAKQGKPNKVPKTSANASEVSKTRKYTCQCGKAFTTSGHLARHNRIHTGEKNFVCIFPGCGAKFSRQDNCNQHFRTHTNKKSPTGGRKSGNTKKPKHEKVVMPTLVPDCTLPTQKSALTTDQHGFMTALPTNSGLKSNPLTPTLPPSPTLSIEDTILSHTSTDFSLGEPTDASALSFDMRGLVDLGGDSHGMLDFGSNFTDVGVESSAGLGSTSPNSLSFGLDAFQLTADTDKFLDLVERNAHDSSSLDGHDSFISPYNPNRDGLETLAGLAPGFDTRSP